MIGKAELEEILERVESGTSGGEDADKLREYTEHLHGLVERAALLTTQTGSLIADVLSKQTPPPERDDQAQIDEAENKCE